MLLVFCTLLMLGGGSRPATMSPGGPEQSMLLADEASVVLLDQARREILSGRLAQAEGTLYQLADREDGRPAAYHHLATASLFRVLLFDRDEDYERFFARSDSLRQILADHDRSADRSFLEGEADFHRALAWAKKGSYVRAAMAGVSAYRVMTQLVEDDSNYLEAYKSLGIVHTMLGILPARYRRVLSIFGFETDVQVGLDQLEIAATQTVYGRQESLVFMSILDSFKMPTRVEAHVVLRDLYDEYDQSPLFAMVLVDALLRTRRVEEADQILETVIANSAADSGLISIAYLGAFVGDVRFKQERWAEAAQAYGSFMESYEGSALKSVSAVRRGLALEMLDKPLEAAQVYRSLAVDRDFDSDAASARAARIRLLRPMSMAAKTLLRARCAYDRSDTDRADALLSSLEHAVQRDAAIAGELAYRRGRLLDETGRDGEAVAYYRAAITNPVDREAKWAPYSLFFLARIQEEAGRIELAKDTYRRVVDYKEDYDYRGTNEQLAILALDRLRN